MPARLKPNKRRARHAHVTPEAIELFRRGLHDPHNQEIRIALAAALGRSKFAACPLDLKPRSLIGGDSESVEVAIGLRAELLRAVAIIKPLQGIPSRLRSASNKDTERKTDETSHK
jgi:hypothetical protein